MSEEKKKQPLRWSALVAEVDESRSEKGDPAYKLSIGRVMSWLILGTLLWFWIADRTVTESLVIIFLTLMGYNMGKKFSPLTKKALEQGAGAPDGSK